MRYAIPAMLLAFVCLAASALSADDSSVDSFIENSQSGKGEWESSDAFGATTPAEVRAMHDASPEVGSAGTSVKSNSADDASEAVSLVDEYIADSLEGKEEWESDDVFGASTPSEARKIWVSELESNTTLQDNATAQNAIDENAISQNKNATAQNNITAVDATPVEVTASDATSEVESAVDEYIAKSLDEVGEWESDDAFGFATPGSARKAASSNEESQS